MEFLYFFWLNKRRLERDIKTGVHFTKLGRKMKSGLTGDLMALTAAIPT